jgi:hypothetical protein
MTIINFKGHCCTVMKIEVACFNDVKEKYSLRPKKNDILGFKICPKKNDVLLNLVCVHVHVGI